MKVKIEKPHIFISYAWGNHEYQQRVIEFATSLASDGIDVELDKWSLREGNDTYAYMEQMVNNPEITNVLILLDKRYSEKANNRNGGVGTETQIISPEIYNKVNQEKFLPIIFEKGENGEIYKPTYLKTILHYDLSDDIIYLQEYKRLVKRLFGVEILSKPQIGKQPLWLLDDDFRNSKKEFSNINSSFTKEEKEYEIKKTIRKISDEFVEFHIDEKINEDNYVNTYKQLQNFRDEYLFILQTYIWVKNIEKIISNELQYVLDKIGENDLYYKELKESILNEIFIYVIVLFQKKDNYKSIGYIVNKTYFAHNMAAINFGVFNKNNQNLDNMIRVRDNKNYYSGVAQLWLETLNLNFCSKIEFILADILLYNCAIYRKNNIFSYDWFPRTYTYIEKYNYSITKFMKSFVSKEFISDILPIFDYKEIDELIEACNLVETKLKTEGQFRRYPGSWSDAPLILDYVNSKEIGQFN